MGRGRCFAGEVETGNLPALSSSFDTESEGADITQIPVKASSVPEDLIILLPTCDTVQMAKGPRHIREGSSGSGRQELMSYPLVCDKKHPSIKLE